MLRLLGTLLLALSLGIAHADDAGPPVPLNLSYSLDAPADGRAPIDPAISEPDTTPLTLAPSLTSTQPPPEASTPAPGWAPRAAEDLLLVAMLFLLLRGGWQWRAMWRNLARRHYASGIFAANWPPLAIVVPPGGGAADVAQRIQALLALDYPAEKLFFMPLFSADTPLYRHEIARYLALPTDRIVPVACPGAPRDSLSALQAATAHAPCELIVTLDAKTTLAPELLRQIAAPFLDPAVGALQGVRRGPGAAATLTRLLELSRQAITLQHAPGSHETLLPGAALVGVRRSAVLACGHDRGQSLADVALVARLVRRGWRLALLPTLADIGPDALRWRDHFQRVRATCPLATPTAHDDFTLPAMRDRLDALTTAAWAACLALSVLLYAVGKPLLAGPGIALCALLSFDARGGATDLLRAFFPLRATRVDIPPAQLRLLPLMPMLHLLSIAQPLWALIMRCLPRREALRILTAIRPEAPL